MGLESPLISSKPQSHSLGTSGKSEVDDLFVAERQLAKEQQEDGTLQEAGASYQTPGPDPHLPASDERWALDALRNCKFCTCEGPGLCHGLRSHVGRIQRSGNSDFSLKEFYHLVGKKIENLPLLNRAVVSELIRFW